MSFQDSFLFLCVLSGKSFLQRLNYLSCKNLLTENVVMVHNFSDMEIGESIKKAIQEFILPELNIIKGENKEIKLLLGAVNTRIDDVNKRIDDVNKRLDDVNAHLVDQSRRIDETNKRIDHLGDEVNKRIDHLRVELRDELLKTNIRIDNLYEVIVRREEHDQLEMRMMKIEKEVEKIQRKIAA